MRMLGRCSAESSTEDRSAGHYWVFSDRCDSHSRIGGKHPTCSGTALGQSHETVDKPPLAGGNESAVEACYPTPEEIRIAAAHKDIATDGVESIAPYVVSPWDDRLPTLSKINGVTTAEEANPIDGIFIATSSSARDVVLGMGGAVNDCRTSRLSQSHYTYSVTLGTRTEQNP